MLSTSPQVSPLQALALLLRPLSYERFCMRIRVRRVLLSMEFNGTFHTTRFADVQRITNAEPARTHPFFLTHASLLATSGNESFHANVLERALILLPDA